jgi:hypothetical protein
VWGGHKNVCIWAQLSLYPLLQVISCLAAAWSTAGVATAQCHVSAVLTAMADVLETTTRAADQLAAASAATQFAEHCASLAAGSEAAGALLLGGSLPAAKWHRAWRLLMELAGWGGLAECEWAGGAASFGMVLNPCWSHGAFE